MSREKEFFAAVDTIKAALGAGIVMQGWRKDEPVSCIMITAYQCGPTYGVKDHDDHVVGYDINKGMSLSVVDVKEVARRHMEVAQKQYDEAVAKAASLTKEVAQAQKQLEVASAAFVKAVGELPGSR